MSQPYSIEQLEEKLEERVDAVLSSRRTARDPAEKLAAHDREQQDLVLHWVAAAARSNPEMGYQIADLASGVLHNLGADAFERWVLSAMDEFDRAGLRAGIARLRTVDEMAEGQRRPHALALDGVRVVLERFVHGLGGRLLQLEEGAQAYTDTETLWLPGVSERFGTEEENFSLYKATVVHLWAQCYYGTWREARQIRWEEREAGDLARFHRLETLRLDACLQEDLPGIARLQSRLRAACGDDDALAGAWEEARAHLHSGGATTRDSLAWADRLRGEAMPEPCCYQGVLDPAAVRSIWDARTGREKEELQRALAQWTGPEEPQEREQERPQLRVAQEPDAGSDGDPVSLLLDEQPVQPPAEVSRLLTSIHQDFGEIPDEYLVPAGPGQYDAQAQEPSDTDVWKGVYHEEGAFHYPEWDHARGHYRKHWCVLRERVVHPQYDDFAARTVRRHYGLAQHLRKTFEVMRGGQSTHRGEPHGEEVDLDALISALATARAGHEMSRRVFVRQARDERSVAVLFMVDMSGSTKGWVNEVEREALILLCEALERLQDQYAIYGFSGITRKRCELFVVKRFDEAYDEDIAARISGILPQDYTRMGVAIRHLTELLRQVEARSKLLVTLSDGRPEDYTDYRGEYGIEDTRQALMEARHSGIHPFCITIDDTAREYLPHMYGTTNYAVVQNVNLLPKRIADLYRRLTT